MTRGKWWWRDDSFTRARSHQPGQSDFDAECASPWRVAVKIRQSINRRRPRLSPLDRTEFWSTSMNRSAPLLPARRPFSMTATPLSVGGGSMLPGNDELDVEQSGVRGPCAITLCFHSYRRLPFDVLIAHSCVDLPSSRGRVISRRDFLVSPQGKVRRGSDS